MPTLAGESPPHKRGTSKVRAQGDGSYFTRTPNDFHDARKTPLKDRERAVFQVLDSFARYRTHCWPSNNALGTLLGKHPRKVQESIEVLESEGWIARVMTDRGRPERVGILMLRRVDPARPACDSDDKIRDACAGLRHRWSTETKTTRVGNRLPGVKVLGRKILEQVEGQPDHCNSTPKTAHNSTPKTAPELTESSTPYEVEKDPTPKRSPEGGGSISSPGKAEDPGTEARSSDSRPSPQSAQQTPPVPPPPPKAARIKAEARDEAEAGGLPDGAASKLARKAEAAAIAGEPENDIGEAVEAAIARWGQGDGGARDRVAVMLTRFDETIDRTRRRRRANDPDATWEEIPKHRQDDFRAKARNIADDLERHSAPDGGAAAAEFHAQAGQGYREVGVTGRAVREFERATGDPNPHCRFHRLPDELKYRALIDFAWADWHLGRGERDLASGRLRAVAGVIRAIEERIEKENQERFARHRQHVAEEKARKEAEEAARGAFSQTQRDAARHVSEAYERAGGKDHMGKINAQLLSLRATTPEDVDRVRMLAELPPVQLVEIIDRIGRGPGGKSLDQMLAPPEPAPPPQPPAPIGDLERAKANAERLVDFRRSGGVHIADVLPIAIPQAATA